MCQFAFAHATVLCDTNLFSKNWVAIVCVLHMRAASFCSAWKHTDQERAWWTCPLLTIFRPFTIHHSPAKMCSCGNVHSSLFFLIARRLTKTRIRSSLFCEWLQIGFVRERNGRVYRITTILWKRQRMLRSLVKFRSKLMIGRLNFPTWYFNLSSNHNPFIRPVTTVTSVIIPITG